MPSSSRGESQPKFSDCSRIRGFRAGSGTKVVLLNGLPVAVRKARSRTMRLSICRDGEIRLSVPFFVSYQAGFDFFRRHAEWVRKKREAFQADQPHPLDQGTRADFLRERESARALIRERLEVYQKLYGTNFTGFAVRDQRSRWGSCALSGRASFNYRIVYLPPRLQDYVIVHELCHRLEFNHSPAFWSLVARTFPDYRELRQKLREMRS